MRVVINTPLVKRNTRIATYLFFATFAVLIGGFLFINLNLFGEDMMDPIILFGQALLLPVAFLLTIFSVRMTNLWARPPRPENALTEGLKGLSNKSVIYHYHHLPARHILICPQGVFAIVTRWQTGKYRVNGMKWRTQMSPISRLFSAIRMDSVSNPSEDALRAAAHVRKLLASIAPDIQVQPLIIFVDSRATFLELSSDIPVLYSDNKHKPNLRDYLRSLGKDSEGKRPMPLTEQQIENFERETISS